MSDPADGNTATREDLSCCDCYGDPEGSPLCDECRAEDAEAERERAADLFAEDVMLYGI